MAGQAGQQHNQINPPAIVEQILRAPGSFSFTQAVYFISKYLKLDSKTPAGKILYSVNPDLSFPPSDVKSIKFDGTDGKATAEIALNFMGLHGAGSPMPAYFTEYVAQHQDENCPLKDFLNLFNHQIIEFLYGFWLKYRYHIIFAPNASDKLSQRFFSFLGLGHSRFKAHDELDMVRLLSYIGLIAFSGEAAGSLESIMRHYFGHKELSITQCVVRRVAISQDQQSCLGEVNSYLGEDCLLGEEMLDQTGKFKISIENLSWKIFNSFLPCGDTFPRLKSLVRFVMRSQLGFDVELHLKPEEIPSMTLDYDSECRLAWSSWIGAGADGVVLLET